MMSVGGGETNAVVVVAPKTLMRPLLHLIYITTTERKWRRRRGPSVWVGEFENNTARVREMGQISSGGPASIKKE